MSDKRSYWMAQQLTQEQAIALARSRGLMDLPPRERALFQLRQQFLAMDFSQLQSDVESATGRPVWTHEFVDPESLLKEILGEREAPTWDEIVAMLPAESVIVLEVKP